jgi:hypothetical protein
MRIMAGEAGNFFLFCMQASDFSDVDDWPTLGYNEVWLSLYLSVSTVWTGGSYGAGLMYACYFVFILAFPYV